MPTAQGKCEWAILSPFLYMKSEARNWPSLKKDYNQIRRGWALRSKGKGGKTPFMLAHPGTLSLIEEYPKTAGRLLEHFSSNWNHGDSPVRQNRGRSGWR
jgi:hypothetical protein